MKYTFLAILFLLSGCKQDWQGFVYQDKNNLTHDIKLGHFSTLEECRNFSHKALAELNALTSGDYECGLNCKQMFPELGEQSVLVCKETTK